MRIEDEREKSEAEVAAEQTAALVASLRRERAGYVQRGLDKRAAQVDEQLKQLDADDGDGTEQREAAAPLETAVESKPRRTAGSRSGK